MLPKVEFITNIIKPAFITIIKKPEFVQT